MGIQRFIEAQRVVRRVGGVNSTFGGSVSSFTLSNRIDQPYGAEIVLDYEECEGGIPVFEVFEASGNAPIELTVVYSEGIEGVDHEAGSSHLLL